MTCGPAAKAWARPVVITGKRAMLTRLVASALPHGTTLHVKPLGSVAIYNTCGALRAHGFSKR